MALTPALVIGARPLGLPAGWRWLTRLLNWQAAVDLGDVAVIIAATLLIRAVQAVVEPGGDVSAICLACPIAFAMGTLRIVDAYDRIHRARRDNAIRRLVLAGVFNLGLCTLVVWVTNWRTAVAACMIVGVLFARRVLVSLPSARTRVLILTLRRCERSLRILVRESARTGYDVVDVVDCDRRATATQELVENLVRCIQRHRVQLIITIDDASKYPDAGLRDVLEHPRVRPTSVASAADVYQSLTGRALLRRDIVVPRAAERDIYGLLTRAADVAFAALGLTLAAPLLLVVAVAIGLDSPGQPFYRQVRVGRHGKCFQMLKLRTMRTDAEVGDRAVCASQTDPRVTRVGRWLRRCHMDELPQLWNVVRGDMSLVGPRPERPELVQLFTRRVPQYAARHAIRPGITGWAQVQFKYAASVRETTTKLQYDLFYIRHRSLALDLVIMFKTVFVILRLKGI